MSDVTEEVVRTARITPHTVPVYVMLAYESLKQALEALCNLHGYKVLSHVCMGALLRSILPDFDHVTFERGRTLRNSINYYGKQVGLWQGRRLIARMLGLKLMLVRAHLRQRPSPPSQAAGARQRI